MADAKKSQKKTAIRPLADRVLVRRMETPDEKSPAGIIIPDTAKKDKSKIGVVVAVGPGKLSDEGRLVAMTVKPGMKIVFNAGWDNEVDAGEKGEEHFLVRESDVLAIID